MFYNYYCCIIALCPMPIQYIVFIIAGIIFGITVMTRCCLVCCFKSPASDSPH